MEYNKAPEVDLAICTDPAYARSAPMPRGRSAAKQLRRALSRQAIVLSGLLDAKLDHEDNLRN